MTKRLTITASCCLFLLTLSTQSARGQSSTSMYIAGMRFTLGQPKATVVSQIKKGYKLTHIEPTEGALDSFFLKTDGEKPEVLGTLDFTNDKLTSVSKDFAVSSPEDGFSVGSTIFAAISNSLDGEKRYDGPVSIRSFSPAGIEGDPSGILRIVEIEFNGHTITITAMDGKWGRRELQVTDTISLKKTR